MGRNPHKTLSKVICPVVIVSEAHFMKIKLLPQISPTATKLAVALFLIARVSYPGNPRMSRPPRPTVRSSLSLITGTSRMNGRPHIGMINRLAAVADGWAKSVGGESVDEGPA